MRGTYQAYINIAYGVGSMLGAAVGGAMADLLGWRWEFGVQVLPIVLGLAVSVVAVPSDLGVKGTRETVWVALRAFDIRGSLLLTISITFFVLGMVKFLSPCSPAPHVLYVRRI